MSGWKAQWKHFAAQPPGRRFRERYQRRRESRSGRGWCAKILSIVGGIVCLAIGAVLTVAPGPAVVFFALGGILIANESRGAARALDWIDVKLAPLIAWVQRQWERLSPVTRRVATGCMIGGGLAAFVAGIVIIR